MRFLVNDREPTLKINLRAIFNPMGLLKLQLIKYNHIDSALHMVELLGRKYTRTRVTIA